VKAAGADSFMDLKQLWLLLLLPSLLESKLHMRVPQANPLLHVPEESRRLRLSKEA